MDFKSDAVLNFDLLSELFKDSTYDEYLQLFVDQICDGSKRSLEFIDAYVKNNTHTDLLINILCKNWSDFWKFILLDSGYSSAKINEYMKLIITWADLDNLEGLDRKLLLSKYISEKDDFFSFTCDIVDVQKLKDVILKLGVKFVNITNSGINAELFNFVYKNDLYQINEGVIEFIIRNINPEVLKNDSIVKSNYTTILESNCPELISYIDANLNDYVGNVLLAITKNTDENEDVVIKLLNNDDIDGGNKFSIIDKENIRISDISNVEDVLLWSKILRLSKVEPAWDNMLLYFKEKSSIDDAMVSFFNRQENYDKLSIFKLKATDEFPKDLIELISKKLLLCPDLSDESYEQLIKSIPYWYPTPPGIDNVSNSKVGLMIKQGKIKLNEETYTVIKENFNNQCAFLVESNIDSYLEGVAKYALDAEELSYLLSSEIITADHKIKIFESIDASIVDINYKLSKLIYDILLNQKVCHQLPLPMLEILLKQNESLLDKVKLFNSQFDYLDESVISDLLIFIGKPISSIVENKQPTVANNDTFREFAEKLKEKSVISSYKEDGDTLRLYPKNLKKNN